MIQNQRQYQVSKAKFEQLKESLQNTVATSSGEGAPRRNVPAVVRQGSINGIKMLMDDLEREIREYEQLQSVTEVNLDSVLEELPSALVRARAARGMTQRELAEKLGYSEQQVQKDERGGYEKASLEKLRRVASTLGVQITGQARLTVE